MDQEDLLAPILIGVVLWILILYSLIKGAVKEATKGQTDAITTQNRLLIKLLEKQGVSKDELIKLHEDGVQEFWDSLK